MQAFPARTRRLKEFASIQSGAEIIPCPLPVLLDFARHAQVTRFRGDAIQHSHRGQDRHVHFVIARIKYAPAGVQKSIADQISGSPCHGQRIRVASFLVPKQQGLDGVVMAPQIPIPEQAILFGERTQVPILTLRRDEFCNHIGDLLSQPGILRHSQRLHRRNKIFAGELARPRNNLRRRFAIPDPKHFEHAGIRLRRTQQPLVNIGSDAFSDDLAELETRAGDGLKDELVGRSG